MNLLHTLKKQKILNSTHMLTKFFINSRERVHLFYAVESVSRVRGGNKKKSTIKLSETIKRWISFQLFH